MEFGSVRNNGPTQSTNKKNITNSSKLDKMYLVNKILQYKKLNVPMSFDFRYLFDENFLKLC